MKFTKDQIQEAIETIYSALCDGADDSDIVDRMGLSVDDLKQLKDKMFDSEAEKIRLRPIEHTYVQYMIDQFYNLRQLDNVISHYEESKQYNATVGAIRARADILNQLIAKGQEFGLIKKMPDRKEIVGGMIVTELTNEQLKKAITTAMSGLKSMVSKYGDSDIKSIEVGPIHYGEALPEAVLEVKESKEKSKYNKSNNVKRIGGRQVLKKKKI